MKIAITNTKGGVGKTTTAIHLGVALFHHGSVVVYDADPQGSASEWAMRADEVGTPLPFEVRPANMAQLRRIGGEADFVIIDTGPSDPRLIDAALEVADLAIIPTAPSSIDMSRVWETERVSSSHVPSYVLITQADARTNALSIALEVLDTEGVGHFETYIPLREAVRQSFGTRPGAELYNYDVAAKELLEVTK